MSSELLLGKDTPFSFFTIYRLYSRAQETGPQALEMSGNRSTLCFLKQCFRPVACLGEKEGSGLRNKKKTRRGLSFKSTCRQATVTDI